MRLSLILLMLVCFLTGCYHIAPGEEDRVRMVPVTNNPNIIPKKEMGSLGAMPY